MKRTIIHCASQEDATKLVDSYRGHPFYSAIALRPIANAEGVLFFFKQKTAYEID